MKNTQKNIGTENNKHVAATLAKINDQIAALNQERAGLAEPLKLHYADLRTQLAETETQIRELDPSWKPASLRPKADAKIVEILTTNEKPMTMDEIVQAVGGMFSPWKVKSTLKKRSTGAKAVFSLDNGKYSVKVAA
jgi:hypothetical protein